MDKRLFEFALDQTKADYDLAGINYKRIQEAIEKNPNTFSRKQRDEAKASFEAASSAFNLAQYNLERGIVVAVDDGILCPVGLRVGGIFKVWEHSQDSLIVVASENLIDATRRAAQTGSAPLAFH